MSELFSSSVLRVEQPRRGPLARSQYKVFDGRGALLATAVETERSRRDALRSLFPGKSDLDARSVLVSSPGDEPLLVVDKKEGRGLTQIRRPNGEVIGEIRTERIGRRYALFDGAGTRLGQINVDVQHINFDVVDEQGERVAKVRKKWAGVVTHVLTTADRYMVEIADAASEPLRTIAVATAIAMDMALHESKDLT